jgi:hypothetical protein
MVKFVVVDAAADVIEIHDAMFQFIADFKGWADGAGVADATDGGANIGLGDAWVDRARREMWIGEERAWG